MVQANEARVNNYYTRELRSSRGLTYDHEFRLTETEMGYLFSTDTSFALQDLFGIPLSPEILVKCGCAQGDDKEMWRNPMGVWLTRVNDKDEFFIQGFRSGHTIKYLHEYQNAVYILTGEEPSITL